jgi:hypothetical protein
MLLAGGAALLLLSPAEEGEGSAHLGRRLTRSIGLTRVAVARGSATTSLLPGLPLLTAPVRPVSGRRWEGSISGQDPPDRRPRTLIAAAMARTVRPSRRMRKMVAAVVRSMRLGRPQLSPRSSASWRRAAMRSPRAASSSWAASENANSSTCVTMSSLPALTCTPCSCR